MREAAWRWEEGPGKGGGGGEAGARRSISAWKRCCPTARVAEVEARRARIPRTRDSRLRPILLGTTLSEVGLRNRPETPRVSFGRACAWIERRAPANAS